jgi:IclR family pca regulon transcriptional regulator
MLSKHFMIRAPKSASEKASAAEAPRSDREMIAGLARGLSVIRAFSAGGPFCTLTEIANITALSPAAARRCLHTLEELGYAGRVGRRFFLRPRVLELSAAYLDSVNPEALAREYLQEVASASGQSSSLAVLDGQDVIYLARVGARRIVRLEASVGTRYPAYATALGRVLLAGLPEDELADYLGAVELKPLTRRTITDRDKLHKAIEAAGEDGYSIVEDELAIGVLSIAVPVANKAGEVVAAINCSAQTGETSQKALKQHLPILRETAARISGALLHFPTLVPVSIR